MTEVERIVSEYKTGSSSSQETQVETPVETVEQPGATQEPQETVEQVEQPGTAQETAGNTQETGDPARKQPKDTSMYTKAEKAEHAFKRQLAKQREKYESSIAELTGSFQGSIEEIKKQVAELKESKKAPEPVKTRADFTDDDSYIKYLTAQGVQEELSKRDEKSAKEAEEQKRQQEQEAIFQRQQQEVQEKFTDYCRSAFSEPQRYQQFSARVDKALKNGLGEILDNAPAVRDYIFSHADGPVILDEMLTNRESFVRVMQNAGNPIDAAVEMRDLLREVRDRAKAPTVAPTQMPHLGKPGSSTGGAYGSPGSNLRSDDDIINYLRSRSR